MLRCLECHSPIRGNKVSKKTPEVWKLQRYSQKPIEVPVTSAWLPLASSEAHGPPCIAFGFASFFFFWLFFPNSFDLGELKSSENQPLTTQWCWICLRCFNSCFDPKVVGCFPMFWFTVRVPFPDHRFSLLFVVNIYLLSRSSQQHCSQQFGIHAFAAGRLAVNLFERLRFSSNVWVMSDFPRNILDRKRRHWTRHWIMPRLNTEYIKEISIGVFSSKWFSWNSSTFKGHRVGDFWEIPSLHSARGVASGSGSITLAGFGGDVLDHWNLLKPLRLGCWFFSGNGRRIISYMPFSENVWVPSPSFRTGSPANELFFRSMKHHRITAKPPKTGSRHGIFRRALAAQSRSQ